MKRDVRVSVRASVVGAGTALATMMLLMLLGAGSGLWKMGMSEITRAGWAFWSWSFIGWVASCYAGGYAAVVASGSPSERDSMLHGAVTWVFSGLLAALGTAIGTGRLFDFAADSSRALFLWAFVADLAALFLAFAGASRAARREREHAARLEAEQDRKSGQIRTQSPARAANRLSAS